MSEFIDKLNAITIASRSMGHEADVFPEEVLLAFRAGAKAIIEAEPSLPCIDLVYACTRDAFALGLCYMRDFGAPDWLQAYPRADGAYPDF